MPRISSEARAAAAFRRGNKYPKPPASLSRRSRRIWHEIVRNRPVDYFDAGSAGLLACYCTLQSYAEVLERRLGEFQGDPGEVLGGIDELRKTSAAMTTLATKLRLMVQSTVRYDSGKLSERGPGKLLHLIGGHAVDPALGEGA